MNKEQKIVIIIGIVVVLVVIIWGLGFANSGQAIATEQFAKCLADKDITMYGTETCVWCKKQKSIFGDNFKFVPYVDCYKENQKCLDEKIEGTPTWIFPNGKRIESYLELNKLSEESGCPLN